MALFQIKHEMIIHAGLPNFFGKKNHLKLNLSFLLIKWTHKERIMYWYQHNLGVSFKLRLKVHAPFKLRDLNALFIIAFER